MPCIVFGHDDIDLVNGPPEMQRFFFDQSLTLYDPTYLDLLRRYRRVLKSRNSALKEERNDLFDLYDAQLAQYGTELVRKRASAVETFNQTFGECFRRVSGFTEPLHIVYAPSWTLSADTEDPSHPRYAEEQLIAQRDRDLRFGTTTSGPHRDRFRFILANREFTETASTGQLRLVSLVLRVSQAVFFHYATGRRPVLLLDDVLLELDQRRRERFLELLPNYEQAFFTFLPNEAYERYLHGEALVYWVEDGVIQHTKPGAPNAEAPGDPV
jgi:DNA replication and repair protein RecF